MPLYLRLNYLPPSGGSGGALDSLACPLVACLYAEVGKDLRVVLVLVDRNRSVGMKFKLNSKDEPGIRK